MTTLVIPGVNDSEDELRQIAEFIRSVGPEVPWHVSQFYPAYKMLDLPSAARTLHRAARIGRAAGLHYVYEDVGLGRRDDTLSSLQHAPRRALRVPRAPGAGSWVLLSGRRHEGVAPLTHGA